MRTLQSSVRNKRFGLATNSSSTHSIIFNPEVPLEMTQRQTVVLGGVTLPNNT